MSQKIALLRITLTAIDAYQADLPNTDAQNVKLTFSGPFNVAVRKEYGVSPYNASDPIFDPANQEIIWAVHGRIGDKDPYQLTATVWRIGAHFGLHATDPTPLPGWPWTPPMILQHGDLLTVSMGKYQGDDDPALCTEEVAMAQRGKDSQWMPVPFNSRFKNDFTKNDALFQGNHSSIVYVHRLRARAKNDENILIVTKSERSSSKT